MYQSGRGLEFDYGFCLHLFYYCSCDGLLVEIFAPTRGVLLSKWFNSTPHCGVILYGI